MDTLAFGFKLLKMPNNDPKSNVLDFPEYRDLQEQYEQLVANKEAWFKENADLRKTVEELRTVIHAAKDAIILIDEQGHITLFNPAAEQMFGRKETEMLGEPLDILMPEAYREKHHTFVRGYFTSGKPNGVIGKTVELPALRKDGTEFPIAISLSSGALNDEKFVIAVARDISDIKAAEEEKKLLETQLQNTQKLESLGVLAGGIAHDFNNLLMGILGNADLALMTLPEDSPSRALIMGILKAAGSAADLTNQMLAYSGKGRLITSKLDLSGIIAEMTCLIESSVSKRSSLTFDLAQDLPPIEADPSQMQQVVLNLAINASEAIDAESSGIITITTRVKKCDVDFLSSALLGEALSEGTYVSLEVTDTGCGLDEATAGKIFDPFFTTKFMGRGLGLSAVMGIVRSHQGALKVTSRPAKGTTFEVLFPVLEGEMADPPAKELRRASPPAFGAGKTILLIDDEEVVQTTVSLILKEAGFDVLTAGDGMSGIELLHAHQDDIACVLLDLTMPRMDGKKTYREIRKINETIPVLLTSGYNEHEIAPTFDGQGLAGFIQKPYQIERLYEKLQQILSR
ncbi:MAG: PAS domain S-box protein [Myxococcota bacterium]|nr:PAS domain S-box protein [Myxococcota bacterium]